ncbi:P-loop containing nucleoside triphosphate hydrolase protein [Morchella conica CCBAS932]|uniref:P-loop containing nucleoside triphosphate hydrolase protein n=1 Tax=Morchella conica CCBAS932 TaxID=1392247 RepID=A0A3N4KE28_9PEZI|nr:P-loop containing nucleoside triphosphate hydrolase protein [Morchella conica CCBAS932]
MGLPESKNRVGLGRALMNSNNKTRRLAGRGRGAGRGGSSGPGEVMLTEKHEADWYKMRSITQQNDLDEFLTTAELADTDFTAEKMDMKIIHSSQTNPYLLNPDQERTTLAKHTESKRELTVPRRPAWDSTTTPAELDRAEKDSFLQWRRGLAQLEESKDLLMTPFERNLEVWRQLWRVIERSDLVVQIVDARNPLLFRSEDLERYVLEVGADKRNLLLVNKADMMTLEQRMVWAEHFEREGIRYRFFSAALAKQSNEEMEFSDEEESGDEEVEVVDENEEEIVKSTKDLKISKETAAAAAGEEDWEDDASDAEPEESIRTRILTIDELEDLFLEHAPAPEENADPSAPPRKTQIGLVGYPNVGKSSTINALIGAKKVSVSSTPGKTKHFQTLHLSDRIILCDCPGLVFPNFATTKAELVCNGVLPIDQLREFTGPAALVAKRIPKPFLEKVYGIKVVTRPLEEGGTGIPTGEELLYAYAKARGFTKTGAGNPDESRAARYILKDYVNGKLLFCHPPNTDPPIDALHFNRELYSDEHLPSHRRTGGEDHHHDDDEEGAEDMVVLGHQETGRKSSNLDKQFFGAAGGSAGHLRNPFHQAAGQAGALQGGKGLSGRKARTMIALDNGLSPEEVRTVMGSKKHFKKGKKREKVSTHADL